MTKITAILNVVAATELERAIAQELEVVDGNLTQLLAEAEESIDGREDAQDNTESV